ncbi:MAG: gamma-glutamyltransferase [Hyphomicrobiaceae bacterium]|nr:gamma-glutamyltransferase [Hyphomicrobiaceae bacterium]
MRNFHFPGRSPVYGRRAMCATSHPAASLTAIDVLKAGGNAVDAAIAAAAVLCVVEPAMTGIGGDCFAIMHKPGRKKLIALNASGRAPKAATPAFFAGKGVKAFETTSVHSVTVPGAIDGWCTLHGDYGSLPFERLLEPAIELADKGFVVAPRVAADWANGARKLTGPGARLNLLKDGKPPRAGEVMRFAALARTLKRIAKEGRAGFYEGEVARDMVKELNALGGCHTLADFAAQRASYVEPIAVDYKGVALNELPPSNHGIVALIMLRMLARLGKPPANPVSAERYHLLMEVARQAFALRDAFVADPDMADVPVEHMLSDAVVDKLARRIDRKRHRADLGPIPQPAGSDTVCFSIVDEKGLAVSFINSLYGDFGTGICASKSGVTFHNRGEGFVLDPKHRNCVAPGKRPMHTLVPAMATRDGKPLMAFGVMGAHFQPMGHVYMMSNILDYGMDVQEAVDAPRVFFEGDGLQAEHCVPDEVVRGLEGMGHKVSRREMPWGGAQIVMLDRDNGTLIGASDARKDGMALGY